MAQSDSPWFELISELLALTKADQCEWSPTDTPDEFVVARRTATVSIFPKDHDGQFPFVLSLSTPEGQNVDAVEVTYGETRLEQNVRELYRMAREKALGTTDLVRDLLKELREDATPGEI
jgi:hypothetical protein